MVRMYVILLIEFNNIVTMNIFLTVLCARYHLAFMTFSMQNSKLARLSNILTMFGLDNNTCISKNFSEDFYNVGDRESEITLC